MATKATPYFQSGQLTVLCPNCLFKSSFPGQEKIDVFVCEICGEPVEVEKTESQEPRLRG
jgi:transcription initiation factor IIE alpha subunit